MTFNEVKSSYDNVRREKSKKKRALKENQALQDELLSKKSSMKTKYKEEFEREKEREAADYKKKMLAPVEQKIVEFENKLERVQEEYSTELEELTIDSVASDCSSQQEIMDEIHASMEVLQEGLEKIIGKHFCNTLLLQLENSECVISEDELPKFIEYFNDCSEKIEAMTSKSSAVTNFITLMESNVSSISNESVEQNKNALAIICLVLAVLLVLASKFVFPVLIVCLCPLIAFNVVRSYKFYRMLVIQKTVQDNISSIENVLQEKIQEEYDKRHTEICSFYDKEIQKFENEISSLKKQILSISMTADTSFEFDGRRVQEQFDNDVKAQENRAFELKQKQVSLEGEIKSLGEKEIELQKQLDELTEAIKGSFFAYDKPGTNTIFDPNFLFDIEMDTKRPVPFIHPQNSCLIIYTDYTDACDFIRLLNAQLRVKLSPFVLSVLVSDFRTLGNSFLYFKDEDSSVKELFNIVTTQDELDAELVQISAELKKRIRTISREFKNIEEYNKSMKSIDSVTATYQFLFYLDPESRVLESQDVRQISANGGSVGIFSHFFIHEDDVIAMGNNLNDFVKTIEKIYVLKNGNIQNRSKAFILEQYAEKTKPS